MKNRSNTTINWQDWSKQSNKLPRIVFHQKNYRPHTFSMTRQKMEVSMLSPYSPDFAPLDCHLFRSMQKSLNRVKLASIEACENYLSHIFAKKPQKFFLWNNISIWFNKVHFKLKKKEKEFKFDSKYKKTFSTSQHLI